MRILNAPERHAVQGGFALAAPHPGQPITLHRWHGLTVPMPILGGPISAPMPLRIGGIAR